MAWAKSRGAHFAADALFDRQIMELMSRGEAARHWHLVYPSHHRARGRAMWTCKLFKFHLILTFRDPEDETIVSYRRLYTKGLPYTQLKKYPTLDAALQHARFDFAQLLLETENAKPDLDNDCLLPSPPSGRRVAYPPREEDSVHPPVPE